MSIAIFEGVPAPSPEHTRTARCKLFSMATDFAPVFTALKSILAKQEKRLAVKVDTPIEYTLVTRSPSPFPQHKGEPMWFGAVKQGKAYVSYHLMALYMNDALTRQISPELKKRMQGKTCFNFKTVPEPGVAAELHRLTDASVRCWTEKKWL